MGFPGGGKASLPRAGDRGIVCKLAAAAHPALMHGTSQPPLRQSVMCIWCAPPPGVGWPLAASLLAPTGPTTAPAALAVSGPPSPPAAGGSRRRAPSGGASTCSGMTASR
jgi:hypothetical protein